MNSSRLNDDAIIRHRIAGRSMRAIAKSKGIALADVNRALDLFTEATFNDKVRSPSSAPGSTIYRQAKAGDVQSAQLVAKLIERRCVMLGVTVL